MQRCSLMEGSCTDDVECENGIWILRGMLILSPPFSGLICSLDVCPTEALWDSEEKCCEKRCTMAHPCQDGED